MKLRTVAQRIASEVEVSAGKLIVSGVTGRPELSAAFLVVGEGNREKFIRSLRFYAHGMRVAAAQSLGSVAVALRTHDRDEAEYAVITAAYAVVRGQPAGKSFLDHPQKWPAVLKKLAK